MKKYKLLKDINHPLGDFKSGDRKTIYQWLDEFDSSYDLRDKITTNTEWFEVDNEN